MGGAYIVEVNNELYTWSIEPLSLFSGLGLDLMWTDSRTNLYQMSWWWSSTLVLH